MMSAGNCKAMELFIVRQYGLRSGQTVANVQRTLQGQQDGELTELGIQQASRLGRRLQGTEFAAIYCSDLKRCRDTLAQILQFGPAPDPVFDPRLREKGGGVYEGSPLGTSDKEAKKRGIRVREFRPEGGESWLDVNARAKAFLQDIIARHVATPCKVLVVSHGGCIMELNNVIREFKHQPSVYANIAKNTSLTVIRISQKGGKLTFFEVLSNDTSHLS